MDVLKEAANPGKAHNRDAENRKRGRRAMAAAGLAPAVLAVAVFALTAGPEQAHACFLGIPCR